MPAKKKARAAQAPSAPATHPREEHSAAYDTLLEEYGSAMDLLRRGEYAEAKPIFDKIEAAGADELRMAERARTYARICQQRLGPTAPEPGSQDERFHRAVFLSNAGRHDEAIGLLDLCLKQEPESVHCLYARASAQALKGQADRAVSDLRRAIGLEPRVRFQALNDPDFEKIREEPAFIDVIEPTSAGA